jgi:hypothetical protein
VLGDLNGGSECASTLPIGKTVRAYITHSGPTVGTITMTSKKKTEFLAASGQVASILFSNSTESAFCSYGINAVPGKLADFGGEGTLFAYYKSKSVSLNESKGGLCPKTMSLLMNFDVYYQIDPDVYGSQAIQGKLF